MTSQDENIKGATLLSRVIFLENRIKGIRHNCLSQASFFVADAETNKDNAKVLRAKAEAYEAVAGWLKCLVDE